jgi:hypothetical protein
VSAPSGYRLRVYRFPAHADFGGHLAGALERMLLIGAGDLRDALFVLRDAGAGEAMAADLRGVTAGGTVAPMLDFRLDERRRRAVTDDTLAPGAGRVGREVVAEVADALEPGGALLAVVTDDRPVRTLEDAVARTGGLLVADEPAGADRIAELEPTALALAARARTRTARPTHTT